LEATTSGDIVGETFLLRPGTRHGSGNDIHLHQVPATLCCGESCLSNLPLNLDLAELLCSIYLATPAADAIFGDTQEKVPDVANVNRVLLVV
jgi:hypothetical protein